MKHDIEHFSQGAEMNRVSAFNGSNAGHVGVVVGVACPLGKVTSDQGSML
jgi:hypothetical protein